MQGSKTKAGAAFEFAQDKSFWPARDTLAYQLEEDGLWYATSIYSPAGVALRTTGADAQGRTARRIERIDDDENWLA